jgi:hypothetical protein
MKRRKIRKGSINHFVLFLSISFFIYYPSSFFVSTCRTLFSVASSFLLGVFSTKLLKCASSLRHVCLSVCMQQHLENPWTDFHFIWCQGVFLKFVDTFQFWLKSDKNRHISWRPTRVTARVSNLKTASGNPQLDRRQTSLRRKHVREFPRWRHHPASQTPHIPPTQTSLALDKSDVTFAIDGTGSFHNNSQESKAITERTHRDC